MRVYSIANLRSARCSPVVFSNVLAAGKRNLMTARARKKKHSARMLAKTIRYPYISLVILYFPLSIVALRTVAGCHGCKKPYSSLG